MSTAVIPSIKELVKELLRQRDPSRYAAILERYAVPSKDLEPYYNWNSKHYTRTCIHRNESFELLVICYEPGQATSIHDYDSQTAWVHPVIGEVVEERYRALPKGSVELVRELRLRPGLFTGFETMLDAVREGNAQIVDGLSADQHAGRAADLGLSGHIPGAVNVPGAEMVNATTGRFLPLEQLGARIPGTRDRRTIIYCGSGIAAASVAFVMQRLGYGNLTIYMPGLQEWVERPGAPLVTGVGQGDESPPESPPFHD